MVTEFIETATRVFRIERTPDSPGICKRQFSVQLESGEPMTDEEWHAIIDEVIAEAVSRGCYDVSWRTE